MLRVVRECVRSRVAGWRRGGERRGFALPLVLMVAMVATLAATLILERQGPDRLAVRRQAMTYKDHHRNAGLREMIHQWIATAGSATDLGSKLDEEGRAFDLVMPGGEVVRVSLFDAQGTVLGELSGVSGRARAVLLEVLRRLGVEMDSSGRVLASFERRPVGSEWVEGGAAAETAAWRVEGFDAGMDRREPRSEAEAIGLTAMLRDVGPINVSVATASDEVIEAVCEAVSAKHGATVAEALIKKREDGSLGTNDVQVAAQSAGMSREEMNVLVSVLTTRPQLWRVELVSEIPGSATRMRGEGLLEIRTGGLGSFERSSPFLSWEVWEESRR